MYNVNMKDRFIGDPLPDNISNLHHTQCYVQFTYVFRHSYKLLSYEKWHWLHLAVSLRIILAYPYAFQQHFTYCLLSISFQQKRVDDTMNHPTCLTEMVVLRCLFY